MTDRYLHLQIKIWTQDKTYLGFHWCPNAHGSEWSCSFPKKAWLPERVIIKKTEMKSPAWSLKHKNVWGKYNNTSSWLQWYPFCATNTMWSYRRLLRGLLWAKLGWNLLIIQNCSWFFPHSKNLGTTIVLVQIRKYKPNLNQLHRCPG